MLGRRRIVHGGVVAQQDHLRALQAHDAIGLGPAAVVAQGHAHHPAKAAPDIERFSRLEVVLLQMLECAPWFVLGMPRQMHFAVLADDLPVLAHQDGCIEAALDAMLDRQLRIAQVKAYAQLARGLEQHPRLRTGHLAFVEGVDFGGIFHVPARKKRRQRQLRKHHQLAAHGMGLAQMREQALHDVAARVAALDRPKLRGRDIDDA